MGNRIGGVANLTVDGQQYPIRGNWSVSPNRVKREGIAGQDSVHGYTEMPVVPGLKGDFSTRDEVLLSALQDVTESTVQITLANSKTYVLSQAWSNGAFEINTSEGRFGIEFGGFSCDEV